MAKEGVDRGSGRGSGPGQISQAYLFRCKVCLQTYVAESRSGYLNVRIATRWAR